MTCPDGLGQGIQDLNLFLQLGVQHLEAKQLKKLLQDMTSERKISG